MILLSSVARVRMRLTSEVEQAGERRKRLLACARKAVVVARETVE